MIFILHANVSSRWKLDYFSKLTLFIHGPILVEFCVFVFLSFPFCVALLGTKPEGLLRTNYNLVFTNIAASLHGFHDILKGEGTGILCFSSASFCLP